MAVRYGMFKIGVLRTSHLEPYQSCKQADKFRSEPGPNPKI